MGLLTCRGDLCGRPGQASRLLLLLGLGVLSQDDPYLFHQKPQSQMSQCPKQTTSKIFCPKSQLNEQQAKIPVPSVASPNQAE